jgi:hypothetical protein
VSSLWLLFHDRPLRGMSSRHTAQDYVNERPVIAGYADIGQTSGGKGYEWRQNAHWSYPMRRGGEIRGMTGMTWGRRARREVKVEAMIALYRDAGGLLGMCQAWMLKQLCSRLDVVLALSPKLLKSSAQNRSCHCPFRTCGKPQSDNKNGLLSNFDSGRLYKSSSPALIHTISRP